MHEFYWPHMANDVYATVYACKSCARNNPRYKRQRPLQVFPPSESLDFIAMDILDPLPRTRNGNQKVVVTTYWYVKLKRAIPTAKTTATYDTNVFFQNWVTPYSILKYFPTDNGSKSGSKFFATTCRYLVVKHLTTTAYHPQANGQVEQYSKTIATRFTTLRSRKSERLKDLGPVTHLRIQHADPLINKYNSI